MRIGRPHEFLASLRDVEFFGFRLRPVQLRSRLHDFLLLLGGKRPARVQFLDVPLRTLRKVESSALRRVRHPAIDHFCD